MYPIKYLQVITAQLWNIERFTRIKATKVTQSEPPTKITIIKETPHLDPNTGETIYMKNVKGAMENTLPKKNIHH